MAGGVGSRLVAVGAAEGAELEALVPADLEHTVEAADPAVLVHELAVGHDQTDARLRVEVVAHTPEHVGRRLAECGVVGRVGLARRLIVGDEEADGGLANLAGNFRAVAWVDDRAGVHDRDRAGDVEDFLSLEEERTQFLEEQREALVQVDLRAVRFNLREVGVEGEVERQVRGEPVFHAEAPFLDVGVAERPGRGVAQLAADRRDGGQDLEVAAHRELTHAVERAHLREEAEHVARDRRPDDALVLALDLALDLEAPVVRRIAARGVAQALERNGQLRGPAVLDEDAG